MSILHVIFICISFKSNFECEEKAAVRRDSSWVLWHKPVDPALRRQRQEDCHEFEASLDNRMTLCLNKTTTKKKRFWLIADIKTHSFWG